jgi:hypothetical protein
VLQIGNIIKKIQQIIEIIHVNHREYLLILNSTWMTLLNLMIFHLGPSRLYFYARFSSSGTAPPLGYYNLDFLLTFKSKSIRILMPKFWLEVVVPILHLISTTNQGNLILHWCHSIRIKNLLNHANQKKRQKRERESSSSLCLINLPYRMFYSHQNFRTKTFHNTKTLIFLFCYFNPLICLMRNKKLLQK